MLWTATRSTAFCIVAAVSVLSVVLLGVLSYVAGVLGAQVITTSSRSIVTAIIFPRNGDGGSAWEPDQSTMLPALQAQAAISLSSELAVWIMLIVTISCVTILGFHACWSG